MPGTTPVYGFPYPEPTDLVADYPALGQQLAEDVEAVLPDLGGLVPVAPTSIANTGGSASTTGNTTTFTGVSSVSLNGIFSTDYSNYRLMIKQSAPSNTNTVLALRMRTASDDTSAVYSAGFSYVNRTGAATTTTSNSNSTSWRLNGAYDADIYVAVELGGPNIAQKTGYAVHGAFADSTSIFSFTGGGLIFTDTQYTGVTFILTTGSSFSGSVAVYGYKK